MCDKKSFDFHQSNQIWVEGYCDFSHGCKRAFSIPAYVCVRPSTLYPIICRRSLSANFHVRQRDVTAARKLLGRALGTCAKPCLFKGYIEMELLLGEVDRCRTLYQVRCAALFSPRFLLSFFRC